MTLPDMASDETSTPAAEAVPTEASPANGAAAARKRRRGGRTRGERGEARAGNAPAAAAQKPAANRRERTVHPLLEKLAALYPHLFGARFLPLQRGVYEELLARHPEELPDAELKVALGLHARSGRYLQAIAERQPRHNLAGEVVEPVAPEHVHHAIVELFRRRQGRTQDDLRPQLVARLAEAIEASGLDRATYTEQVRVSKPEALALLDEAFAAHGQRVARREALQRAFEASGQPTVEAFAEMYGMDLKETRRLLKPA